VIDIDYQMSTSQYKEHHEGQTLTIRSADDKVQETQGPVRQSPHQVSTPHLSRQPATLSQPRIPDLELSAQRNTTVCHERPAFFVFRNQFDLVQVVIAV